MDTHLASDQVSYRVYVNVNVFLYLNSKTQELLNV